MTGTDGPARLHEQQIDVPDTLVAALLDRQCPRWARAPRERLDTAGTIHRVDLLGADAVVRVPFIDWAGNEAGDDAARIPAIGDALAQVGIAVPRVLHQGRPDAGLPWPWGVWSRLPGRHPRPGDPHDEAALARGLTAAMSALAEVTLPWAAAPDTDFLTREDGTRDKVVALNSAPALQAWDAAQPPETGQPMPWIHGDPLPGNLLMSGDGASARLTGIIDWGASGRGDRSLDLAAGWLCMGADARASLLEGTSATDAEVARARAYVVRKAAWGIDYYARSLPRFADHLRFGLTQVEAEA